MRIVSTSASGAAHKQMNCFWKNKSKMTAYLTEMFFVFKTTHVHPTRGSLYIGGETANEYRIINRFHNGSSEASYLWQPSLPLAIEPGDKVGIFATAAYSSVSYMAGMNILI